MSDPAPFPLSPTAAPVHLAARMPGSRVSGAGAAGSMAGTAVAFEAAFLSEMLKHSGLTRAFGNLAGGAGESGFSDLLTREIATDMARRRPLGIGAAVAARLGAGG